uniref:Uncharacterized protein n=1 Tax=Castor canadensis TaxID=51338 RepID=A0A8C0XH41_CASCN
YVSTAGESFMDPWADAMWTKEPPYSPDCPISFACVCTSQDQAFLHSYLQGLTQELAGVID